MEFHVSRQSRDFYKFEQPLFALNGNVIFADFHAARMFAKTINDKRDLIRFPEGAIRAGQLNAMGLIDEILHYMVHLYRRQINPAVMAEVLDQLDGDLGREIVDQVLRQFHDEFPPSVVYQRYVDPIEYFEGETNDTPNRQIILEEMMTLWLANRNPAFSQFLELFDDTQLKQGSRYIELMDRVYDIFSERPRFGPEDQNLIDMLRSPAIAHPYSLTGQLDYIRRKWGYMLGELWIQILRGLDMIAEEEKFTSLGPGPSLVYEFTGMELEAERFSQDKEWMPSLVLIAKNIYVWLDQLSKQYRRDIHRLDLIPDEELDRLAHWGINGLWLIGLWERSQASRQIKQLRGNPEAVASAYSLFDYQIALDLGGEESYQNLRDRAVRRGIRLASDMVPNHMGIDSKWVIEHPEWFISLEYSPFPNYSFNGSNLSWDERVGIYIEDHYYDNTDAAVVFKRVDKWTGDTRFIYHGNDGTSMPWNDTAQLNYLSSEVREAVIQTILDVARRFPIIRFDAAMTLAKKHYQRLWFPEPGTGGAIPSRAEQGLPKGTFDSLFPDEFWREVVDRVADEVPDTLLLAEAFWLMEGYFVRTLGMHRVYNSAFMNMLRDEKNQEYRLVIKNTLEFDPNILKRYVNFMNNPDERTAVDQFGKGDKYFGICSMMATMPGLPMIGHGQIEGYAEKYGMEFRRAYWNELPDTQLTSRHEREIFPLIRKRYLFAEVKDFLLYDFYTPEGQVNEDVFAYSNRSGEERALVIYHNRYAEARGWIKYSAAYSVKAGDGDSRRLVSKTLAEGLGLINEGNQFCVFRDQITGFQYIRNNRKLHDEGLYIELGAYKYHVYLDFHQVYDNEWGHYAQLASYLDGRGVPDIDEAMKEIILLPVLNPFRELTGTTTFRWLIDSRIKSPGKQLGIDRLVDVEDRILALLTEINRLTESGRDEEYLHDIASDVKRELVSILRLEQILSGNKKTNENIDTANKILKSLLSSEQKPNLLSYCTLLGWACTHQLGRVMGGEDSQSRSRSWMDEWLLGKILSRSFQELGLDESTAWRSVNLIKALIGVERQVVSQDGQNARVMPLLKSWLANSDVQSVLGINRYQGILWYNQEAFDLFLGFILVVGLIEVDSAQSINEIEAKEQLERIVQTIYQLEEAKQSSGYQVEKLLEAVS